VFHARRDLTAKANPHLAHLQAQPYRLMLQLAKEPNLSQRSIYREDFCIFRKNKFGFCRTK